MPARMSASLGRIALSKAPTSKGMRPVTSEARQGPLSGKGQ